MKLIFKRNESFYIRDGWLEKAVNAIDEIKPENLFHKNDGVYRLGIGSNMVKSVRYWLQASKIIEGKNNQLTDFGKCLLDQDPYLESYFSWFLIHYMLVTNLEFAPVFYVYFHTSNNSFSKQSFLDFLKTELTSITSNLNEDYLLSDTNVFFKSYISDGVLLDPESNYACPLSNLSLIKESKGMYVRSKPLQRTLSPLLILYSLTEAVKDSNSFEIEKLLDSKQSPLLLFNLDRYVFSIYLDILQNYGFITVNKTAGINTVYFEKRLDLKDVFNEQFGGKYANETI